MLFQAQFLVNVIIYGAALGSVLTLLSLGYSIVYGVGGIVNLAHGAFYILAAYIILWIFEATGSNIDLYPISVFLGLLIITIIGGVTYLSLIKPVQNHEIVVMIVTFGLAYFVEQGITIYEGTKPGITKITDIKIEPLMSGEVEIFGTLIEIQYIILMIITLVIVIIVILFIKKSKLGKSIRAVSQDKDAAQLMGININRILMFTIMLSALLAGTAAFLYVPIEAIYPSDGWSILLMSMAVVILGGMGSLSGSVIGAFIISFSTWFTWYYIDIPFGVTYSNLIHLAIIVLMLIIRPQGILGKKERS